MTFAAYLPRFVAARVCAAFNRWPRKKWTSPTAVRQAAEAKRLLVSRAALSESDGFEWRVHCTYCGDIRLAEKMVDTCPACGRSGWNMNHFGPIEWPTYPTRRP